MGFQEVLFGDTPRIIFPYKDLGSGLNYIGLYIFSRTTLSLRLPLIKYKHEVDIRPVTSNTPFLTIFLKCT